MLMIFIDTKMLTTYKLKKAEQKLHLHYVQYILRRKYIKLLIYVIPCSLFLLLHFSEFSTRKRSILLLPSY